MIKIFAVLMSLQLIISPVAIAQTAGDQFRANPDAKAAGGIDYMGIMKGMAMGAIGTSVVTCTQFMRLPSMMLFMAGSLAYIANEMTAAKGQSEFLKKKAEDIKMLKEKMTDSSGGSGENQRKALELALEDEEALLKNAEKRLKGTQTVSMIFTAATAMAVIEALLSTPPMAIFPPVAGCGGATSGIAKTVGMGLTGAYALSGVMSGNMMGGAAAVGGYFLTANTAVGGIITGLLNKSLTRAAGFAVVKMIFDSSKGKLQGTVDQLKENVGSLKSVLATFDQNTIADNSTVNGPAQGVDTAGGGSASGSQGGSGSGSDALVSTSGSSSSTAGALDPLANVSSDQSKNCWKQTETGPVYSTDCTNPLAIARPTFDANINVPTLRNATNSSIDYAQAIAKGDTAGADTAASSLASMATKLDTVKKEMIDKLNKGRAEKGLAAFDPDKEAQEINKQLNTALGDAFKNDPAALAALSGSSSRNSDSSDASGKNSKDGLEITTATAPTIADPGAKNAGAEGFGISENGVGLQNEGSAISEGDLSAAKSLEDSLSEYESSVDDISKRSEDSIFKQVSMRYQANYDRFFERKKPEPEPIK